MLYICPTPIGNLEDVTLRVLTVLRSAELIACEDTRHTRILLDRHGITARLVSFHEHNEEQRLGVLLPLLREGKDVAVVSDAGMPGLSDPGFTLVRACAAEGLPVTVLPGPSAVPTALVASGLPADRFAFVGFLPRGAKKLVEQIAAFDGTGAAVVAFEAPRRLTATLEGDRRALARSPAGGLPGVDQAARAGDPRDGGRSAGARSRSRCAARSCWCWSRGRAGGGGGADGSPPAAGGGSGAEAVAATTDPGGARGAGWHAASGRRRRPRSCAGLTGLSEAARCTTWRSGLSGPRPGAGRAVC